METQKVNQDSEKGINSNHTVHEESPTIPEQEIKKEGESDEKSDKSSDKFFFYAVAILVIVGLVVIYIPKWVINTEQLDLEALHAKNLAGKLDEDKGFVMKGRSFVFFDNLWYAELSTPAGDRTFNVPFHFSPREVAHIQPIGTLNFTKFQNYRTFYSVIDATDEEGGYLGVAKLETAQFLINAFGRTIVDGCIKNETLACSTRPIVQCNSTDLPVLYFASEDETNLLYIDNCAIISGRGAELLKATDRMLYDFLGLY